MLNKHKQHYLPKCYLKQFTVHDEKVFVYEKDGKLCRKKYHPTQICYEKRLYEIDIKQPDNKIENYFSNIENFYSELSQKFLSFQSLDGFKLSYEEKMKLLLFVLRIYFGNIKRKEENILSQNDDTGFITQIACVFNRKFIEQFLLRKDFVFILPQDNKFFLTSDNPVIVRANSASGLFPGTQILSDMNFDVPLSPYLALRIVDKGYTPNFTEGIPACDTKEANLTGIYNKKMFEQCNRFVYAELPFTEL